MGFRSSFSKSLFQSGPGYRANLAQSGKLCGSFGGMDSASELADGIADLADGVAELADSVAELADGVAELADCVAELADCVAELADGVITKHGTALHGTRLPRTTRFRKKMQLSAKLGYIHCDAKDVIAGVPFRGARFLRMHACAAENPRCRVLVTNLVNEKGCEKGVPCNRKRRSGVLGVE